MMLILKNLTSLSISRLISLVSAFFLSVIIARNLGPENYGIYALVFVMIGYFSTFIDLGVSEIVVREIASQRKRSHELYRPVLIVRWILYIISLTLCLFYVMFAEGSMQVALLWGVVILLGEVLYVVFDSFFRGNQNMYVLSICEVVFAISRLVLGAAVLFIGLGLNVLLMAIAIATWIKLILVYIFFSREPRSMVKTSNDFYLIKFLLAESKSIALWRFISTIYMQMNIPFIVYYISDMAAGHFKAATNLVEIPIGFIMVVSSVMYPYLAELQVKNLVKYKNTIENILTHGTIVFFLMAFVIQGIGKDMLLFIFGEKYRISGDIVPILFLLVYTNFVSIILSTLVVIERMQNKAMVLAVISTLIKAGVYYLYFNLSDGSLIVFSWIIIMFDTINVVSLLILLYRGKVLKRNMIGRPLFATLIGLVILFVGKCIYSENMMFNHNVWILILSLVLFACFLALFRIVRWQTIKDLIRIFKLSS